MKTLNFTTEEQAQIKLRFQTMYDIITSGKWTTGAMGKVREEEIVALLATGASPGTICSTQ